MPCPPGGVSLVSGRAITTKAWGDAKFFALYRDCKRMLGASSEARRAALQDRIVAEYVRLVEAGVAEEELAPKLETFVSVRRSRA